MMEFGLSLETHIQLTDFFIFLCFGIRVRSTLRCSFKYLFELFRLYARISVMLNMHISTFLSYKILC